MNKIRGNGNELLNKDMDIKDVIYFSTEIMKMNYYNLNIKKKVILIIII